MLMSASYLRIAQVTSTEVVYGLTLTNPRVARR